MSNGNYQFHLRPKSTIANFESDIGEEGTFVSGDSFWFDCGTGMVSTARRRAIGQANLRRGCGLGRSILTIVQLQSPFANSIVIAEDNHDVSTACF